MHSLDRHRAPVGAEGTGFQPPHPPGRRTGARPHVEQGMQLGKDITAVVTGGASGLGAATARALAAKGVRVAILDLNEAAGQKLHDALSAGFARARREAKDHLAASEKADATEQGWLKLVEEVIQAGTLTRAGAEVKAASRVKVNLGVLLKF